VRLAIKKHWVSVALLSGMVVIALAVGTYILSQQEFRFPLVEESPKRIQVELQNAQAVQPGQGQTVRVAGIEVGRIGDVKVEDGLAVVDLEIDRRYENLVRSDATALLRPKTALKDMFIEVDPGNGKPLEEGERIQVENTEQDVDPDEILAVLDHDTRDYLKLLISGAGKGLRGRGIDLRETFRRFGPLHRDLKRVTSAIARRRQNLGRLVNRYGLLTTELGRADREIVRLVQQSNAVLSSFAAEDQNLSSAVSTLPGALEQTSDTLAKVDTFGQRLGPALNSIRPAFRKLDEANAELLPLAREGTPIVRDQIRPFARIATPYTRDLGFAARDLSRANPDLTTSLRGLNRLFNIGANNPGGAEGLTGDLARDRARDEGYLYWLAWTAQNTVSLFSTSDAQGPLRRIYLGGLNCSTFVDAGLPAPVAGALGSAGVCVPVGGANLIGGAGP
jgi:phospholipid/cholesterol/gamma-HCH transport system substrate-binding protein